MIPSANSICEGEEIQLAVNNTKSSYLNYGGEFFEAKRTNTIRLSKSGKHEIALYIDQDGNKIKQTSVSIEVHERPSGEFEIIRNSDFNNPVVEFVSSENAGSANWYVDNEHMSSDLKAEHLFNIKGNYAVKMVSTNRHGCKDSSIQSIRILRAYNLMASSVFDPQKETWLPLGLKKNGLKFELRIVNDEGKTVFTSHDPNREWDGKVDGETVQNGDLFIWLAKVQENNSTKEYGSSFLIRSDK